MPISCIRLIYIPADQFILLTQLSNWVWVLLPSSDTDY